MRTNRLIIAVLLPGCLLAVMLTAARATELSTLFTTPQERQVINANRYKTVEVEPVRVPDEDEYKDPVQSLLTETVTREYMISGITLSREGPHTVWINSVSYEDGGELDDRSRIKVMDGDKVRVRITAPDGKQYYATSGEHLEIRYQAPIRN